MTRYWATQQGGGRFQMIYQALTLTTAFSITGAGNTIQAPWGSFPGYLSMIDQDFNRANEKAWLVGFAYDFSKDLTGGLSGYINAAWGTDSINPTTRQDAPNQAEYDFNVDYRPPWITPTPLRELWDARGPRFSINRTPRPWAISSESSSTGSGTCSDSRCQIGGFA